MFHVPFKNNYQFIRTQSEAINFDFASGPVIMCTTSRLKINYKVTMNDQDQIGWVFIKSLQEEQG